jgi:hypothetical protein
MIEHTYTEPVSKLLILGSPDNRGWRDYLKMGFTREHIPELIRLVEDKKLRWMESPSDLSEEDDEITEWYGQIHAWRTLAQLKAEEAIPALLSILQEIDDYMDDWYGEDSFKVFPMIGPAAIHLLAEYLSDTKHGTWARVAASASLEKMVKEHPETKEECAVAIVAALQIYKDNDESLNGSLISDLVQMGAAREHLDLIEEAFKSGNVDESVDGDFEDTQIKLGLREKRSKPRLNPFFFKGDRIVVDKSHPIIQKEIKKIQKEKNKHKQEKKSRKRNRKK